MVSLHRLCVFAVVLVFHLGLFSQVRLLGAAPAPVDDVERQPFVAATKRVIEALDFLGSPLSDADKEKLREAMEDTDNRRAVRAIQSILDPNCLAYVTINPESRVSAVEGAAKKELVQQGWRAFLIKTHNLAGTTPKLNIASPNAEAMFAQGKGARDKPKPNDTIVTPVQSQNRFLDIYSFDKQPLKPELSGLAVEYRIVQLYSRDTGIREATLSFDVGAGSQDLGFRGDVPILFQCAPSVEVVLGVRDFDLSPTTAAFVFKDSFGRVYPLMGRRLAPDFFFHEQIYRADGESIHLPPGEYEVEYSRGPEYVVSTKKILVKPGIVSQKEDFRLTRWIHPRTHGWFSGDHHVHAAGCAHYDSPTEGVTPGDMMRHILGEDLNVGCVLSWGPCWYAQKQYFEGKVSALSKPNYLMRYDVEVSGFPSSHAGHLCLLRLTEDDYPGTNYLEEWPSWTMPVLQWGQKQGGVVGYSHSGWGLELPDVMPDGSRKFADRKYSWQDPVGGGKASSALPDYAMPKFDGIGANEFIVTVAHDACDFISAVDTPSVWELNIWYHTLNCGFRSKISGETDFPCIYGEKVGLGRIYVKMPKDQPLDYDAWVRGLKDGRSYCGDGLSHILDFRVNDVSLGEAGSNGAISQLSIDKPGKVKVAFDVAALLEEKPNERTERIRKARLDAKPYWHLERSRIGNSRMVPVEIIVNGYPVATKEIEANGDLSSLSFDIDLKESSWVAARIFPSVHTNPVFVEVGGKPIRASKRSAKWCRDAVDVCWKAKVGQIRESERATAKAAYEVAGKIYEKIASESQSE